MKHLVATLLLLSACTTMVEPEVGESEAPPRPPTCPDWGCGTNSATVGDGLIFDYLDGSGEEPNRGGLRVISAVQNGQSLRMHAYGSTWVGTSLSDPSINYMGDQLVGTIITLNHPDWGDYEVLISAYNGNDLHYWVGGYYTTGSPVYDVVPYFELKTRKVAPGTKFDQYACRDKLETDPFWHNHPQAAVVFAGDYYDPIEKRVEDRDLDDHWFNIACAATVPAKMHMMRYTNAAASSWYGADFTTSWRERTALVKMFTADYCGTGRSFTVDGTALEYQEHHQWPRSPAPAVREVEALWTEYGASCLTNSRRPLFENEIFKKCGFTLPKCPRSISGWESSSYMLSGLR